jgi:ankyrin repeat protein
MKKKDIKTLFSAIRKHENATSRALLTENPNLVNVISSAPPKKDDGQSPLQVAFKTGNFEIAAHLIDLGANVHFMEAFGVNEWRDTVLHDALRATVFSARDRRMKDRGHFTAAIALVRRMLSMGVDPYAVDSFGNNSMLRALLDSRQRLSPEPGFPDRVGNQTLNHDLRELFAVLLVAGADIHAFNPKRESAVKFAKAPALAHLLE